MVHPGVGRRRVREAVFHREGAAEEERPEEQMPPEVGVAAEGTRRDRVAIHSTCSVTRSRIRHRTLLQMQTRAGPNRPRGLKRMRQTIAAIKRWCRPCSASRRPGRWSRRTRSPRCPWSSFVGHGEVRVGTRERHARTSSDCTKPGRVRRSRRVGRVIDEVGPLLPSRHCGNRFPLGRRSPWRGRRRTEGSRWRG